MSAKLSWGVPVQVRPVESPSGWGCVVVLQELDKFADVGLQAHVAESSLEDSTL